ncbi:CDC45-like protein [Flagelloscypha sp. PMI_526]|nr:CDC45-like protein [Flagelloscypha sp. PMI_526]
MVYLPYPTPGHPTYDAQYKKILCEHRKNALSAASSVIILVAPDVDALCAARMLASLFRQDDVMYHIKPIAGPDELEIATEELRTYTELRTLILLNMGGMTELLQPDWFGDFDPKVTVHVIDSARPRNLALLFDTTPNGNRILVWDDGTAETLQNERLAWEAIKYQPEPDSDASDDEEEEEEEVEDEDNDEVDYEQSPGKRRSLGSDERKSRKRRKLDDPDNPKRMTWDEREAHITRLDRYYTSGTSYGLSATGTIYSLADALDRVDNDLLWLSILGLTHQYTTGRISRDKYDEWHRIYSDVVASLNPLPPTRDGHKPSAASLISSTPDDMGIRATEEYRFMLFRHWTLYDAMFHSSYVASKLGIWREKGRKRLTGLLAKMGFSIPQTQQSYAHMDLALKRDLHDQLHATAPEYGLVQLSYASFGRCFGYIASPMSASDAVEGISALLEVAGGVKMEVEIEGGRNGGEWFGGSRVWEGIHSASDKRHREEKKRWSENRENIPPGGTMSAAVAKDSDAGGDADLEQRADVDWWLKNFWIAYDALSDITILKESLALAMSLHKAIIRTGTSIIDKQDIKTMRHHHVVILTQGPDLALFCHPAVLSRLAIWLVEALREHLTPSTARQRAGLGAGKKKSLPFVVACLNEAADTYVVVGVMAAMEFGDIRKNEFGLAFLDAKQKCNAKTRHSTFDTSILEIEKEDLKMFLDALCNDPSE